MRITALALLAASAVMVASCTPTRDVYGQDPQSVIDLNYRFSDDDARATAEAMIDDCLSSGWLDAFREEKGHKPIVIVGSVKNDTSDYIDSKLFTKQIERRLLNSGRIKLVAAKDERGEVRDERHDIQDFSRPETVKQMAYELGADLMLMGVGENVQINRGQNVRVQYYQVNMELIDIESNEKLWIGEKQIEKTQVDKN